MFKLLCRNPSKKSDFQNVEVQMFFSVKQRKLCSVWSSADFFSAKLFKVASFCSLQHGSLFERCRPLQPDCRDVRRRHAALRWRHRLVQRERARLSREGPAKRRSCRRQSRRRRQRRHRFRQNQRSRCRRKGSFELIFWKFYRFGWHSSFFGQACFMIALLVCSFAFDVKKHSRASTLLINSPRT